MRPSQATKTSGSKPLSFRSFIRRVNPYYRFYRHTEVLIAALQKVADGETKRLMVFLPPRHSKSETVSRLFAAYFVHRYPRRFVGLASYGADLAYTLSRQAREYYRLSGGRFAVEGVEQWETDAGGGMWAAGVGGPATGKGFHCLPGDSEIITECGTMTIETLCRLKDSHPRILSYDHTTQRVEWRRIVATAIQPGKPLVEIALSDGSRIRCTTDHAVYCAERGYRQAGDLVPGETLIQVAPVQGVRTLRDGDEPPRAVLGVLPAPEGHSLSGSLCALRRAVRSQPPRDREVAGDRPRSVLLDRVQPAASCGQASPEVPGLREADGDKDEPLLSRLPCAASGENEGSPGKGLPVLRHDVSPEVAQAFVLFGRMRTAGAFDSHAGQGKQQLQGRGELFGLVPQDAPDHPATGWAPVRSVRGWQCPADRQPRCRRPGAFDPGDPPHRQRHEEQQTGEPDYAVPGLPHDASQDGWGWQPVTVSSVTRLGAAEKWVYDLQVERNHNFFADGILVHNCGIVDDPLKNAEDAASATIREKQKEWWRSTFYTRQEPDAAIIVLLTRWNEDDLAGWLLSEENAGDEEPEGWHIISMPAICGEGEPTPFPASCTVEADWRQPGEALCPERYPVERLRKYERRLGSYFWGALFQQHPKPRAGLMFQRDWFTVVEAAPRAARRVRYWDKAGTAGGGKATAGVLLARDAEGVFYVEHVVRGQYSALERERIIQQTAEADAAQYGSVDIWMEQEPGSGGKESAENTVRSLAGFKAHKETVSGDKVTRAEPFAAQCEARNVRLVRGAWNANYLDELTAFPHGTFADQVDGSSGAFNKLTGSSRKIAQVR